METDLQVSWLCPVDLCSPWSSAGYPRRRGYGWGRPRDRGSSGRCRPPWRRSWRETRTREWLQTPFSDALNPIIITAVRLRFRRISKMSDMLQKWNKQRLKLPCVTFQLQGSIRCCTKLSFVTSMERFCKFFISLLCLNATTLITRPCWQCNLIRTALDDTPKAKNVFCY